MLWTAAAMLFLLAATNGRPAWWSSGLFVALAAPALIIGAGMNKVLGAAFSKKNSAVTICFLSFVVFNVFSTIANLTYETLEATVLRCFLPFLTYLSMVGMTLERRDARWLVFALAAGAGFMFVRGTVAYVSEFGMPDFETMMWARYDTARISGYSDATLGNVGHMGAYVVLVVPCIIQGILRNEGETKYGRGTLGRGFLLLVAGLGLFNLAISGSRSGIVIMGLLLAVMIASLGIGRFVAAIVVVVAVVLVTLPEWIGLLSDENFLRRYMPWLSAKGFDGSAEERLNSVLIGWDVFLEHPLFGIGPGMSPFHNFYGVPHESLVHQLSELGLVGGIVFGLMNTIIVTQAVVAMVRAGNNAEAAHRFRWLIGPAGWLVFGLSSGISFNANIALAWMGIASAMLGIAGASLRDPAPTAPRRQNPVRLR